MKTILERVRVQHKQHLPFVVYRKPNSKTLVAILQQNDHLYFSEDLTEKGFVFAPFDGTPICFPYAHSEVNYNNVYPEGKAVESKEFSRNTSGKQAFETLVTKGIQAIADGVFRKLVLSRKEEISVPAMDWMATFTNMLEQYPTAFCYCWYHPKVGMWLGATPEKLFQSKAYHYKTMALAGTQPFQDTTEVSWNSKEIEEQAFVTHFIVEHLKKESKAVQQSETYTTRAGNLWHLRTDITGELLPETSLQKVIAILHPTPAVCGLPKDLAKTFIAQEEGYNREFYSGYLGEIHYDFATQEIATDLFVNLRCMQVVANQVHLYVGCGITKDSIPEAEWEETVNKSLTMKQIIT